MLCTIARIIQIFLLFQLYDLTLDIHVTHSGNKNRLLNSHTAPTTILERQLKLNQTQGGLHGSVQGIVCESKCNKERQRENKKNRVHSTKEMRERSRHDVLKHNK